MVVLRSGERDKEEVWTNRVGEIADETEADTRRRVGEPRIGLRVVSVSITYTVNGAKWCVRDEGWVPGHGRWTWAT